MPPAGLASNGDPFDILPVIFELPDGTLHLASLDRSVILEVPSVIPSFGGPATRSCAGTRRR